MDWEDPEDLESRESWCHQLFESDDDLHVVIVLEDQGFMPGFRRQIQIFMNSESAEIWQTYWPVRSSTFYEVTLTLGCKDTGLLRAGLDSLGIRAWRGDQVFAYPHDAPHTTLTIATRDRGRTAQTMYDNEIASFLRSLVEVSTFVDCP